MTQLERRVGKLEQSQGKGNYCLLYPKAWSDEKLAAEVAQLEKTQKSVLAIQVDNDDHVGLVQTNTSHEDALKQLK